MPPITGLLAAQLLDGRGGSRDISWEEVSTWRPEQGILWLHLDYAEADVSEWLHQDSGLDPITAEALAASETRPRSATMADGYLVVLRGVNLNPGADPEDMVAVRLWISEQRIISVRHRRLLAVQDIREALAAGNGPCTPSEFLVDMTDCLSARMSRVIDELDDSVDALQDDVLSAQSHSLRARLADVRREAIALRRYLAPQRDVMARMAMERIAQFRDVDRLRLREIADRITRYVEDLDAARERAAVTQEELASRLAEQMNSKMFLLSIVAAVFLPLGFVTGLLGINVGGIPGAENPLGFFIVCGLIILLIILQMWLLRRKSWL